MQPWFPFSFILAGLLLLLINSFFDSESTHSNGQNAYFFHSSDTKIQYLLFLPEEYRKQRKKWPLILYLHGASLRGNNIEKLKKYGLPRKIEEEKDFPFMVLSPQCSPNKSWREADWLIPLIDEVIKTYSIDPERVYLTEISLGGSGTWYFASKYLERFAAIAPLCGYGDPRTAKALKNMPVWVFHGEKDHVVPITISEEMVEAIRKAGGKVKFTKYPEAGHSIVEKVYSSEELFEWFLIQRK